MLPDKERRKSKIMCWSTCVGYGPRGGERRGGSVSSRLGTRSGESDC